VKESVAFFKEKFGSQSRRTRIWYRWIKEMRVGEVIVP